MEQENGSLKEMCDSLEADLINIKATEHAPNILNLLRFQ